jgi:hypothetical protein
MSDPLVFVTTHRIAPGQEAAVERLGRAFAADVEAARTGLVHFGFHLDEDGGSVANVQVHRDAASMDAYLPVVADRIHEALELTTTETIDVYGEPGPVLREVLRHNWEQGARVRVLPRHLAGFSRSPVAA